MVYNPSQHPRYGQRRPQGSSRELGNYEASSYEPSAGETQQAWRDNRDYRQDEGYRDQDYRQYPEYRSSDDDRSNPNYRPDQDYELGQQYRLRADWEQSGRSPSRGSGYGSQDWSQPQRGYRATQFRDRHPHGEFESGNQADSFRPSRDYGMGQYPGRGPLYPQGNQFNWGDGGGYSQPDGATAGWQNRPTRDDGGYDGAIGAASSYGRGGGYGGGYGMQYPGSRQGGGTGLGYQADGGGYREQQAGFRGRAPKGYERSDERIREDVCECLTHDSGIDASEISVTVKSGVVSLEGTVSNRHQKYRVEDLADNVSGVKDVQNRLNVMRTASGGTTDVLRANDVGESSSSASKMTRQ